MWVILLQKREDQKSERKLLDNYSTCNYIDKQHKQTTNNTVFITHCLLNVHTATQGYYLPASSISN